MKNRKVVFVKPWEVELVTEDFNEKDCSPDEIIVRNRRSLISPGTELACLSGKESWFKLPSIPGYISVGEAVNVGGDFKNIKKGDTVYSYGPHVEYFKIGAGTFHLKLPENIPEEQAVFTRIATIAFTAVRVSDIELGDYVGVTGMGLVGNIAAQLAQLQGGNIIGIDIDDRRLKIARDCGIRNTLLMGKDMQKVKEDVFKKAGNEGFSTLIDATGIPAVVADSMCLMAKFGEVILLGSPRGEYRANVTDIFNYIHLDPLGNLQLKGAHEWRFPVNRERHVKHSIERNSLIAFDLIKRKALAIEPLITHVLAPEEAQKAYDGLRNEKDKFMGVVFDWSKIT